MFRTKTVLMFLLITAGTAAAGQAVKDVPDGKRLDQASKRLSAALQIETVSPSGQNTRTAEFSRFHSFLSQSFPLIHSSLQRQVIEGKSLLYTWKGTNSSLKPVILLSHIDVVPAEGENMPQWQHPPFSGDIADGYIWGRGARDFKAGLMGIMESAEYLLSSGFKPERTIYFAFGHDEEIQGYSGAAKIASFLKEQGVDPEFVLDEGGGVTQGMISGLNGSRYAALIGIAEKGYLSLKLSVESDGGHSASPSKNNPILILGNALRQLEAAQFQALMTAPVEKMLESLAPEMSFPKKQIYGNLWLSQGLVKEIMLRNPETAAMVRSTMAFTFFTSGIQENVIPPRASAVVNIRMMPGMNSAEAISHVKRSITDPRVRISVRGHISEPAPVSETESAGYRIIQQTIKDTFPGAVVCPSIVVGTTDSRHFAPLCRNVYRFAPSVSTSSFSGNGHKSDERLPVKNYSQYIEFYTRLLQSAGSDCR